MLEVIIQFSPIFIVFAGAVVSLVVDYRNKWQEITPFCLLVLAASIELIQGIFAPVPRGAGDLYLVAENAIMTILVLLVVGAMLFTINDPDEPLEPNLGRFFYVLVFLVGGSLLVVLHEENLLMLGFFMLVSQVFTALLKFIFPVHNKVVLNVLILVATLGFILLVVGCLIQFQLGEITGGRVELNLLLSVDAATFTPEGSALVLIGFTILALGFPLGSVVVNKLYVQSHPSVKLAIIAEMAVGTWILFAMARVFIPIWPSFAVVAFIIGICNVCTGIGIIGNEFLNREERRITHLVYPALLVDTGIQYCLIGIAGEGLITNAGTGIHATISATFMLSMIISLVTKPQLILGSMGLVKSYKSDLIEEMSGGRKLGRPLTLAGFLTGSIGGVVLGLFVLDGLFLVGASLISNIVFFWFMIIVLMFTATWAPVVFVRITLGHDLPAAIRNKKIPLLKRERAVVLACIVASVFLLVLLVMLPNIEIFNVLTPLFHL